MSSDEELRALAEPERWNPHWNYHLGGAPRSICACTDGPYEGARLATIPRFCERCGGLVNDLRAALPEPTTRTTDPEESTP